MTDNKFESLSPQTCACILSLLESKEAAIILQNLPKEAQIDIARRVALMDTTDSAQFGRIEEVLKTEFPDFKYARPAPDSGGNIAFGGLKCLGRILKYADRSTKRNVIYSIEDEDPELGEEINRHLFLFEDIVQLDDRAIQAVLRNTDFHDLAMALKNTNLQVREKIIRNISQNSAKMLTEDMESMGPIAPEKIEEAQFKIAGIIRCLIDYGGIAAAEDSEKRMN
jgi:flagellar motor switch protein FliG